MSYEIDSLLGITFNPPKFQPFERVKVLYYCDSTDNERCFSEGLIIGMEFCPPNTEEFGWWYKVIIYSFPVNAEYFYHDEAEVFYDNEIEMPEAKVRKNNDEVGLLDLGKILNELVYFRIETIGKYKTGKPTWKGFEDDET
jgi:hypothetical protein